MEKPICGAVQAQARVAAADQQSVETNECIITRLLVSTNDFIPVHCGGKQGRNEFGFFSKNYFSMVKAIKCMWGGCDVISDVLW